MPEIREIWKTEVTKFGQTEAWQFYSLKEDGVGHGIGFPSALLDNLAAEYDIDPSDFDTLVDIALHQPHITPESRVDVTTLPADQVTTNGVGVTDPVPVNLYNADSIDHAREVLLARVEEVKTQIKYEVHTSASRVARRGVADEEIEADPLAKLRKRHKPNAARIAARKLEVENTRRGHRGLGRKGAGTKLAEPTAPDPTYARRVDEMVKDSDNVEFTVAPGWVTLALSQE